MKFLIVMSLVLSCSLFLPGSGLAKPSDEAKCYKKQLKMAAKAYKSHLLCAAKAAQAGTTIDGACLQKADDKLRLGWTKNDAKSTCVGEPNSDALDNLVQRIGEQADALPAVVYTAATANPLVGPDPESLGDPKCLKKRLISGAKAFQGQLKCHDKAAIKGESVDQTCLDRADLKFRAGWIKNDAKFDCGPETPELLEEASGAVSQGAAEFADNPNLGLPAPPLGTNPITSEDRLVFFAPQCPTSAFRKTIALAREDELSQSNADLCEPWLLGLLGFSPGPTMPNDTVDISFPGLGGFPICSYVHEANSTIQLAEVLLTTDLFTDCYPLVETGLSAEFEVWKVGFDEPLNLFEANFSAVNTAFQSAWPRAIDGYEHFIGEAPQGWKDLARHKGEDGYWCHRMALAQGLVEDDATFRTWTSTDDTSPANSFIKATERYVLPSGTVVAESWADLVDGSLAHAIDETVTGASPSSYVAITGTAADGTAAADPGGIKSLSRCEVSAAYTVATGNAQATDDSWSDRGNHLECDAESGAWQLHGIYCFQQTGAGPNVATPGPTPTPTPVPPSGFAAGGRGEGGSPREVWD